MPLYEYLCKTCGRKMEKRRKFSDPPLIECPFCAGELEQLISAPAVQFKGGGWFADGYGSKSSAKSSSVGGSSDSGASASSSGDGAKSGSTGDSSASSKSSGSSDSSSSSSAASSSSSTPAASSTPAK